MSKSISAITISDELSGDVAVAILTRLKDLDRDPLELLDIVRTVHGTLQDLSSKANERRMASRFRIHDGC